jgi:WD40 repeat protein
VAIAPDGKRALSGSEDNTLKLWDLDSGRELRTFTGHSNSVLEVAIHPDGLRAISGSVDKTLKLWNLATGEVLATLKVDYPVQCCAIAPDGLAIVAGDKSGRMYFLRLEGG